MIAGIEKSAILIGKGGSVTDIRHDAREFLEQRRIAVAGVSRNPKEAANLIFRKLRDTGHEVYAVNPRATEVEGVSCHPALDAIPDQIDACVIATPPGAAAAVVDDCAKLGIKRVWLHRSFGEGSVSEEAVSKCREHGITVIAGACPMMYCEPVDMGHRCIRWVLKFTGRLPQGGAK